MAVVLHCWMLHQLQTTAVAVSSSVLCAGNMKWDDWCGTVVLYYTSTEYRLVVTKGTPGQKTFHIENV